MTAGRDPKWRESTGTLVVLLTSSACVVKSATTFILPPHMAGAELRVVEAASGESAPMLRFVSFRIRAESGAW